MPLTRPKAAQINFDVTTISDPLLRFNSGQTGSNDKDSGFIIERGDDTNVGLVWDESADEFAVISTTETGTTSGNITISAYANIKANAFYGVDMVFEGATADDFETTLTVTDPTADRTITLPDATGTAALLESTQTFTGAITFDASGNSVLVSDTLRIAQSGSGLRMTNVGAFDNDGSDNFRIYGTNNLYLRANGENGGGLSIDSTNQDVTIDNDLRVSAGQFYYGGTAVTSTATELNLLDGVTGTLVTEAGSQTLTNKRLASPTVTGNLTVDTNTLFVDSTNNRVGIGTTSPAVGLDFQMINSGEGFRVRRHNASDQYIEITEGDGSRHEIKANGTKEFRITNTTANSAQGFHFFRNGAERLRILGDGLITFQDGAGTVAFTSDITTNSISQGDSSLAITDSGTGVATLVLDNATHTTFNSSGITLASGVFSGTATSAQYADLAEMYAGDKNYEVGTVVCVGGDKEVTECNSYADSKLAGVVSDKPAYLMNRDIEAEYPICVGFVGRVPVKVVGHIEKGDLLTTSEIKGFATKFSQGSYNPGCIIGLSLNDKKDPGEGTVEVLLKRS